MSRLIDNQIWNARSFTNLSVEDKLLLLYLQTSPETNYYGVFILPDNKIISARTGIEVDKIEELLIRLQQKKKIAFIDDHIIIFNYYENQKGEKLEKGLENFKMRLPKNVLEVWEQGFYNDFG